MTLLVATMMPLVALTSAAEAWRGRGGEGRHRQPEPAPREQPACGEYPLDGARVLEVLNRGEGRQALLQELDRLEQEVRRAIAPDRLEFDEDAPVGAETEAVLGEWGVEHGSPGGMSRVT